MSSVDVKVSKKPKGSMSGIHPRRKKIEQMSTSLKKKPHLAHIRAQSTLRAFYIALLFPEEDNVRSREYTVPSPTSQV